jgi:membrane protease YdiL (CAAX protease family)
LLISSWPILMSSLLFAAAHSAHGPDPIPLFFLALGLGFVYSRTHRILPCVVVHGLLNSSSLAALWLAVTYRIG